MWKDGAKSYCAKCNKVYNVETGEAKRADLKANTCKDVTLDIQG